MNRRFCKTRHNFIFYSSLVVRYVSNVMKTSSWVYQCKKYEYWSPTNQQLTDLTLLKISYGHNPAMDHQLQYIFYCMMVHRVRLCHAKSSIWSRLNTSKTRYVFKRTQSLFNASLQSILITNHCTMSMPMSKVNLYSAFSVSRKRRHSILGITLTNIDIVS